MKLLNLLKSNAPEVPENNHYVTTRMHESSTITISNAPSADLSTLIFPDREIDIVLSATLCVINLYLVLATFTYCIKHSHDNLKWTNRFCAISALALFFGTCWYQLEIHIKYPSGVFCNVYTIVNVFLSIGNRTLVYVILWVRQRFFYQSFALLKVTQKKFNYLSYTLLVLIISLSVIQVGTLSGIPSTVNEIGCKAGTASPFLKIFTPVVFIIVSLFQVRLKGCSEFIKTIKVISHVGLLSHQRFLRTYLINRLLRFVT